MANRLSIKASISLIVDNNDLEAFSIAIIIDSKGILEEYKAKEAIISSYYNKINTTNSSSRIEVRDKL